MATVDDAFLRAFVRLLEKAPRDALMASLDAIRDVKLTEATPLHLSMYDRLREHIELQRKWDQDHAETSS